jgi:hypothetical protein
MRLTIKARQEVTKATAHQYRGASKKEQSKIQLEGTMISLIDFNQTVIDYA